MAPKNQKLEEKYQNLQNEHAILKCKLDSKVEALIIMSRELEQFKNERDQFKLMADQIRERYSNLKRKIEGWGPSLVGAYDVRRFKGQKEQSLAQLLCELKEQNKALKSEADDLRQKFHDAQGDIKLLREQLQQQRNSFTEENSISKDESFSERETMVFEIETLRYKCSLLEKDLQSILDEKEELITARDAYCRKVDRLNQQMNCILRGDEQNMVDVDAILMENRYLQERFKQVQEEKSMIMATLSKYKNILEKKSSRGSSFKMGSSGVSINTKQFQQLLQTNPFLELPNNPATLADLRTLVIALFEALNDKTLALSHQKKTNKILGHRLAELEKKVRNLQQETGFWTYKKDDFGIGDAETLSHQIQQDAEVEAKEISSSSCELNSEISEATTSGTKERTRCSSLGCGVSSPLISPSFSRHLKRSSSLPACPQPKREPTGAKSSLSSTPNKTFENSLLIQDSLEVSSEQNQSNEEDLPPHLQEMLAVALAELEKRGHELPVIPMNFQNGNSIDEESDSLSDTACSDGKLKS